MELQPLGFVKKVKCVTYCRLQFTEVTFYEPSTQTDVVKVLLLFDLHSVFSQYFYSKAQAFQRTCQSWLLSTGLLTTTQYFFVDIS
jgi:hypothetical protein